MEMGRTISNNNQISFKRAVILLKVPGVDGLFLKSFPF